MRFDFSFVDDTGRELSMEQRSVDSAMEALHEARRIADHAVTEPSYLCDFGHAYVRVESEDRSLVMRLSIESLLDDTSKQYVPSRHAPMLPLAEIRRAWFSEDTQSWRFSR